MIDKFGAMFVSTDPDPNLVLQKVLGNLTEVIKADYMLGGVIKESDVQSIIVNYIKRELRRVSSKWFVGATHKFNDGVIPDVLCYYASDEEDFYLRRKTCIRALIEIKWFADTAEDLKKLSNMQNDTQIITWMVYGDHFSKLIHELHYRKQLKREKDIESWVAEKPGLRGASIVKVGGLLPICDERWKVPRRYRD